MKPNLCNQRKSCFDLTFALLPDTVGNAPLLQIGTYFRLKNDMSQPPKSTYNLSSIGVTLRLMLLTCIHISCQPIMV